MYKYSIYTRGWGSTPIVQTNSFWTYFKARREYGKTVWKIERTFG